MELGVVATDEGCRNMGLLSALVDEFNRRFLEGGYELCMIAGIPGFYKRYGYQYAIPLENQFFLELRDIEDYRGVEYSIVQANNSDCEVIASFYREHVASYTLASEHRAQEYAFMMDRRYDQSSRLICTWSCAGMRPQATSRSRCTASTRDST
jgi:predicted acetyltransferase